MNTMLITGNLVREPDYREFSTGGGFCSLRIADSTKYVGRGGEAKEETLFIDVRAFNKLATTCRQFLSKGSKVLVSGTLKSEEYTTRDGQKRTSLFISAKQIEFLSAPPEERAPRRDAVPDDPGPTVPVDRRYAPTLDGSPF